MRFRVRLMNDTTGIDIATSIQVIIPEGTGFYRAKTIARDRINEEMLRYAIEEALRSLGIVRPQ